MKWTMFLAVWTGGYELPSMFASPDREVAYAKFKDWVAAAEEDDMLTFVGMHPDGSLTTLEQR